MASQPPTTGTNVNAKPFVPNFGAKPFVPNVNAKEFVPGFISAPPPVPQLDELQRNLNEQLPPNMRPPPGFVFPPQHLLQHHMLHHSRANMPPPPPFAGPGQNHHHHFHQQHQQFHHEQQQQQFYQEQQQQQQQQFHHAAPPPGFPPAVEYVAPMPQAPGKSWAAKVAGKQPPPPFPQQLQQQMPPQQQIPQVVVPQPIQQTPTKQPTKPQTPATVQPAQFKRPMVILLLGNRGSGKSTQSKLLADTFNLLSLSSGEIVREGKRPLLVLEETLERDFAGGRIGKYNGLVLDRFVALNEADAYYVNTLLAKVNMAIDFVFLLQIDQEVAQKRADAREGETKPKSFQRRMMEHRAQFETCVKVFEPMKNLVCVECDNKSIDEVFAALKQQVVTNLQGGQQRPKEMIVEPLFDSKCPFVSDFKLFLEVRGDMHTALGTTAYFADTFPGSQMAGIVDARSFEERNHRSVLKTSFATLKADGHRLLLVQHSKGVFGFINTFMGMYDLSPIITAGSIPPAPADAVNTTAPCTLVLDCELLKAKGENGRPIILVFDFLYFFGILGAKKFFEVRYKALQSFFGEKQSAWSVLTLKKYVPAKELGSLLADFESAPFGIDGVVFQHAGFYKGGRDPHIYKWKPQELCTADFRLCNAVEPQKKGAKWTFHGKVCRIKDNATDEVTYPECEIRIKDSDVQAHCLSDGSIVECLWNVTNNGAFWKFVRPRPDKLYPNREEIAQSIQQLAHLSYAQLKQSCATLL